MARLHTHSDGKGDSDDKWGKSHSRALFASLEAQIVHSSSVKRRVYKRETVHFDPRPLLFFPAFCPAAIKRAACVSVSSAVLADIATARDLHLNFIGA